MRFANAKFWADGVLFRHNGPNDHIEIEFGAAFFSDK